LHSNNTLVVLCFAVLPSRNSVRLSIRDQKFYKDYNVTKKVRKSVDWAPIEKAYQETKEPVSALARRFSLTSPAIAGHMRKRGILRNATPEPLDVPVATTTSGMPLTCEPEDSPAHLQALKAMRARIVADHRVSIETDHTRLNLIAQRLDQNPRLTEKMRLDALQAIVKVRETLIKLERQAHQIIEQAPAVAPVAVQVNVNIAPHDAYQQMIGRT
jgi:hypothetical protein